VIRAALLAFGAVVALVNPIAKPDAPPSVPSVVVIKLVDKSPTEFAFEPSVITVKPGDIVRFEMTSINVHNVEFKSVPDGTDLGDSKTSGFMTTPTQKFEITIDTRFRPGTYSFVCTPHVAQGMKGTLVVVDK
jgi:plastocyanin